MPYTEKQKRFFGAELGRLEEGKATRTGMSKVQLSEGIHAPTKKKKRKKKYGHHNAAEGAKALARRDHDSDYA